MKPIAIVKPGLKSKDKMKLSKEGFTVIESSDYDSVRIKLPPLDISNSFQLTFTNCYCCGVRIYMTTEVMSALKNSHETFYCIYGHSQSYTKTKTT